MNKLIGKYGLFVLLIGLFISCHHDDVDPLTDNPEEPITDNPCSNYPLVTIDDDNDCNANFFLICEAVEVADVNRLSADDFEWLPMLCNSIGDTIQYKNDIDESFSIIITNKDHFINKSRTSVNCDISIEHASYICQSNETAYIEFSSSIFGDNITRYELHKQINEVKEGKLGASKLLFTLGQPRFGTNVHNFSFRVVVDEEKEHRSQFFHNQITLNNNEFKNVYEFKIRETFWGDPYICIYLNKGNGILGFQIEDKFWLRDN